MSVTTPPKVTVITTVDNSAPYLAACLDSLQKQTFPDFEVLIVDDGSVDGSDGIYSHYAAKDKRIHILRFDNNHGAGYCRAASLRKAHGEYIAVLDAADTAAPYRLERQVAWLNQHPNTVLVASHFGIINKQGDLIGAEEYMLHETEIRWRLIFGNCLGHSTVMFRRQTAIECGGYDPGVASGEDMDLYSRLLCHGAAALLPERLVFWRSHDHSLTRAEKANRLIPVYSQLVAHSIERHLGQTVSPATAYALFNNVWSPAQDIQIFTEALKITLMAYEVMKRGPWPVDNACLEGCVFRQLMDLQYRNKQETWWPQASCLWKRAMLYLCYHP